MPQVRIQKLMAFLLTIDSLKTVERRVPIADGSRNENTAEHCWHTAVAAALLGEFAPPGTDIPHAITLALFHDLPEVQSGDTYIYGEDRPEAEAREREALGRLCEALPGGRAQWLRSLWEEFTECKTPEAKFANAMDRLLPSLLHFANGGRDWVAHGVTRKMADEMNVPVVSDGAPGLAEWFREFHNGLELTGFFAPATTTTATD